MSCGFWNLKAWKFTAIMPRLNNSHEQKVLLKAAIRKIGQGVLSIPESGAVFRWRHTDTNNVIQISPYLECPKGYSTCICMWAALHPKQSVLLCSDCPPFVLTCWKETGSVNFTCKSTVCTSSHVFHCTATLPYTQFMSARIHFFPNVRCISRNTSVPNHTSRALQVGEKDVTITAVPVLCNSTELHQSYSSTQSCQNDLWFNPFTTNELVEDTSKTC